MIALAGLGHFEDDLVGAALAQLARHFEHHRFGADGIAIGLGGAFHLLHIHGEPIDGLGQNRERHQRIVGNVRDRAPLQPGTPVIALMLKNHRVQREHDLGLGQPCQHHHLLAAFGVAFVRHGAAADLLVAPAHFHFSDFPTIERTDFIGYAGQRGGNHGQGADELRNAVTGHMPARQGHLQRQALGKTLQHRHGVRAERRHGADPAEQLHHQYTLAGFGQALPVAQQLIDPAGDLQPEGGRQSGNRVGPGDHQRVTVRIGQGRQLAQQSLQGLIHRIKHIAHLQGLGGVLDVLGGSAVMHVFTGTGATIFLQGAQQWHQRMPSGSHALGQLAHIDAR